MKGSQALVQNLKQMIRAKGYNYKQVSRWLELSEASVKRIFAKGDLSLHRLDIICEHLGVHFKDLVDSADAQTQEDQHLYTQEQELFFVQNPKYLAFFDLLLRHHELKKVKKIKPKLTETNINKYLKKLEQLGLIERQEKDRIKFVVSKNVVWNKNGPLRRTFLKWAKNDFISQEFNGEGEFFQFLSVELSRSSARKVYRLLEDVAEEVYRLSDLETRLKIKTQNHGVLLGLRPWIFSLLEDC